MSRLSVRGLDPAGGSDGQVPVIAGGKFTIGNPPGSRPALPVIDLVTDFGVQPNSGNDDTTGVQNALNEAGSAGGGRIISSKPGVVTIAGALQSANGANAQLLLPAIDAVDSENISIVIEGSVPPPSVVSVIGSTPTPDNQLVFKSTLTTGSGGALLGGHGPSTTYENFTNLDVRLRNLTVRMPANPAHTGLDLSCVACVDLDHVIVDTGSYTVDTMPQPTTATSYGIRLPKINNGAHVRLGEVDVLGFYTGYQASEHTQGDYVAAWGCLRGAEFAAANHASRFARFMAVHCQRGIVFTGTHYVDIWQYDIEHIANKGWLTTVYDIDDASNYGHGFVRWHVVLGDVGIDSTFTVNGAANISTSRVGTVLGAGSSLAIQDENSTIATAVTQLDFQGAGVTAAAGASGEVIVTIPGELLMQDGVTGPPVPLETEARDDWLYQG